MSGGRSQPARSSRGSNAVPRGPRATRAETCQAKLTQNEIVRFCFRSDDRYSHRSREVVAAVLRCSHRCSGAPGAPAAIDAARMRIRIRNRRPPLVVSSIAHARRSKRCGERPSCCERPCSVLHSASPSTARARLAHTTTSRFFLWFQQSVQAKHSCNVSGRCQQAGGHVGVVDMGEAACPRGPRPTRSIARPAAAEPSRRAGRARPTSRPAASSRRPRCSPARRTAARRPRATGAARRSAGRAPGSAGS